jgi:hypothetical protein
LFYASNLDEIVPQDHLLRDIDRFLDFTELRERRVLADRNSTKLETHD